MCFVSFFFHYVLLCGGVIGLFPQDNHFKRGTVLAGRKYPSNRTTDSVYHKARVCCRMGGSENQVATARSVCSLVGALIVESQMGGTRLCVCVCVGGERV
uniref:Secreted protein n=1 Tax=Eutreptiella gymnastica TaxID=73025 RepID=A0A7S4GM27_9EUGL|mmetsp:Transcript_16487/g.26463  ORF Transcript_16487/g.26463 Transcript_16487/m.26463 type:complete len:100 (+) Transcript_16487:65-364(+)